MPFCREKVELNPIGIQLFSVSIWTQVLAHFLLPSDHAVVSSKSSGISSPLIITFLINTLSGIGTHSPIIDADAKSAGVVDLAQCTLRSML
jgi:hypothetical protein